MLQVHVNAKQVNKFIHQLISENQADVFVHIDKKSYEKLNEEIVKHPNVRVLQKSVGCEWGDISQVDATLLLMREVLASKNHYDFVCLRSGQDLLIKNQFKDYLTDNTEKIFISSRKMNEKECGMMKINWPKKARKRYTTVHPIRIFRRVLMTFYSIGINIFPNRNKWPKEYSLYKGSQWFTIPFDVAKYIIKYLDENKWYYKFFENTLVPDESFFNTLLMNSPHKKKIVNDNLYFLHWGENLSNRNSPQFLTNKELELIEGSECFFARKFDENIDKSIVEYFVKKVNFSKSIKQEIYKVKL